QELGAAVPVIALSMGPESAEKVLRESLAMGADEAILLSDTAFSGSDVFATSRALAGAFEKLAVPEIIFCGQQTTDGDTAQLPFALAARLNIPALGWVKKIEYVHPEGFAVLQELSEGTIRVSGTWPALFAVGREGLYPRAPSLRRRLAAQKAAVTIWRLGDMPDTDPGKYGLSGSPTKVQKIYSPEYPVKTAPLRLEPVQAAALIRESLEAAT
ncbi:MAG: electron transfer flavoprotein subunit beta/FixA family protein, partial [Treponema sp.]|nr:electron transfer flavoprotein subunit beta/FixA family protein [Treponema sp.]